MAGELEQVFRQSMRRLATTVSVITCMSEGSCYGITATAVSSLCVEPASLLVCLNASASITEPLLREEKFCVNLLHSDQEEISTMFGGKANRGERFRYGTWDKNEDGTPYLVGAQASLFCTVDEVIRYGTHYVVIGRVLDGCFSSDISPLLYQDGAYARTSRHASQASSLS